MKKELDIDKRKMKLLSQFKKAILNSKVIQQNGESKKEAKLQAIEELKEEGLIPNSHNIAKKIGIYNYKTNNNFFSKVNMFSEHLAKNHQNVKDINQIGKEVVRTFLLAAIEKGITRKSYANYKADLTKLQQVMSDHFKREGVSRDVEFFDKAKSLVEMSGRTQELEKKVKARSYANPEKIIDCLDREEHQLVALIQLQSGARINEASLIDKKRLGGIQEYLGKKVGVISLQRGDAKGGKERMLYLPLETYYQLEKYVLSNGKLHIPDGPERIKYRIELERAANLTGQKYTGSHGLRHNFAQNRVAELLSHGMGQSAALTVTSLEMGHFREDITRYYLRN